MELKECLEMIYTACTHYDFVTTGKLGTEREYEGSYEQAYDTVLNRLEDLENRYLELIINGNSFKIKNDVKELQYIDYGNKEFTLEVLEKWN